MSRVHHPCAIAAMAAVGAAVTLALASCGGTAGIGVIAAFDRARVAFERNDAPALCAVLSREAQLMLGSSAHQTPPFDCARDARRYMRWIKPYRGGAPPRIAGVDTEGDDTATAQVRLPGGTEVTLRAVEEDGEWKLNGLFDAEVSALQASTAPGVERRFTAPDLAPDHRENGSVAVHDATSPNRPPCPPIAKSDLPLQHHDCVVSFSGEHLDVWVWTPFGVAFFGNCDVRYQLFVDGAGKAWIYGLETNVSPCADVAACNDPDTGGRIPWPATVSRTPAGDLRIRVEEACLNTCVGRARGEWELRLTEHEQGWRLRFASMLGTSGWRFNGAVRSHGKPIAIDPLDAPASRSSQRDSAAGDAALSATRTGDPLPSAGTA